MTVEQILERMDEHINLLNKSIEEKLTLSKADAKRNFGSIKTYEECTNMERGAVTSLISLRQWIVNQSAVEKSNELIKDNMWYIDKHNLV